eukprot:3803304-Amphidinium_carterae.1
MNQHKDVVNKPEVCPQLASLSHKQALLRQAELNTSLLELTDSSDGEHVLAAKLLLKAPQK